MPETVLSHQFNISEIVRFSGQPRAKNVFNQFDEHGLLLSLPRIRNEKNDLYKRRILDTFVHIANSTYQGLINGITRELGLTIFEAISVNPKVDGSGLFLAPDPYIRFNGVFLELYSDFKNDVLEFKLDRYDKGGNLEHLTRLIDKINTSAFFEAELKPAVDPYTSSMTVFNQSNRDRVDVETLPESTKFTLENDRLVPGTVFFSNRFLFRTRVDTEAEVDSNGKYYIDHPTGTIRVFTPPSTGDTVRYKYIKYPFDAEASPVIIHSINDDNFRIKMFEQVLQDDGTFAHGLPTALGVEIINELYGVFPMYFGV